LGGAEPSRRRYPSEECSTGDGACWEEGRRGEEEEEEEGEDKEKEEGEEEEGGSGGDDDGEKETDGYD
jgi:hypothetical protein